MLLPTMAVPLPIPRNDAQGTPFLHLISDTGHLLRTATPAGARWCLLMVLMCISLIISDAEPFFHVTFCQLLCLFLKHAF